MIGQVSEATDRCAWEAVTRHSPVEVLTFLVVQLSKVVVWQPVLCQFSKENSLLSVLALLHDLELAF